GRETRALAERYQGGHRPFDWADNVYDLLLHGPLPDGGSAEAFRVGHRFGGGSRHPTVRWYTVAVVELPRTLPTASLDTTTDPADARPPAAGGRLIWTEGGHGPLFAGLRGYAEDPDAGTALFTPEVLARTRALAMDWRLEGRTATGVVPGGSSPRAMLSMVDHLAWFTTRV
ncbi:hypothetical protein, partial [Streptacidiphilus pinicola]|uniref:hypothetical protein n=1 Tax=Streptacidiphilus pinicola TaxID=2219663 RepID=UPI001A9F910A